LAARVAGATVSSTEYEVADPHSGTSYEVWNTSAQIEDVPVLSVTRNLTCSEAGGLRNQTEHTQWDCLLRREVGGVEIIPGPFRVNGRRVPHR
jgi:hypothetical protein